jgi:hypothetical protein
VPWSGRRRDEFAGKTIAVGDRRARLAVAALGALERRRRKIRRKRKSKVTDLARAPHV